MRCACVSHIFRHNEFLHSRHCIHRYIAGTVAIVHIRLHPLACDEPRRHNSTLSTLMRQTYGRTDERTHTHKPLGAVKVFTIGPHSSAAANEFERQNHIVHVRPPPQLHIYCIISPETRDMRCESSKQFSSFSF